MENEAYKEWKKLYSAELNDIWEKECKEIRRAAMVMHILKKEFLGKKKINKRPLSNFSCSSFTKFSRQSTRYIS